MPRLTSLIRATLVLTLGAGLWLPCSRGQGPASYSRKPHDPASFGYHSGRWRAIGAGPIVETKVAESGPPVLERAAKPPVNVAPSSAFVPLPSTRESPSREPALVTWEEPVATRPSEAPAEPPVVHNAEPMRPAPVPPPAEILSAMRPSEAPASPTVIQQAELKRPEPASSPAKLLSATRPSEAPAAPPATQKPEAPRPAPVPPPSELQMAARPSGATASSPVPPKVETTRPGPLPPPAELASARSKSSSPHAVSARSNETAPAIVHKPEPPPVARVPKPSDLVRPVAKEFKPVTVAAAPPLEQIQSLPRQSPRVEAKPVAPKVEPRVIAAKNVAPNVPVASPPPAPVNPVRTVVHRPDPTLPLAAPPPAPVNPVRTVVHRPEPPPPPAAPPPAAAQVIVVPAASARPAVQEPQERRILYRVESNTRPGSESSFLDPFRSNAERGPSQVVDPFRAPESVPARPPLSEREVQPFSVPAQEPQPAPKRAFRGLFSPRQ